MSPVTYRVIQNYFKNYTHSINMPASRTLPVFGSTACRNMSVLEKHMFKVALVIVYIYTCHIICVTLQYFKNSYA